MRGVSDFGPSRKFAAPRNLVSIGGIADMAGIATRSTRSRMTQAGHGGTDSFDDLVGAGGEGIASVRTPGERPEPARVRLPAALLRHRI